MKYRSLCAIILAACAVFVLAGAARADIVAYYSFDTDFLDGSSSNNDLTIATGTPTITTTAGEYKYGGGGLDIDSTTSTKEYLSLTNPITFSTHDAWSVAFWARRRPGTDDKSGMILGNPANRQDFIWLSNNPSQVQGLRFRSTGNQNANFGGFPDDGQFHHWAVIADGAGNVAAYRDDVPQGSVPMSTSSAFKITSVAHAYSSTTQSMDGQIDELYIYDTAIDAATVHSLYMPELVTPGDANGNGYVDDTDLAIMLGNWEKDPAIISTWELGNFTEGSLGDTDVDDSDLAVLLGNWTGPPPPAGAAVPEPATLSLLTLGGLAVMRRRRRGM